MIPVYFYLYIIIGAIICSVYRYLQLKEGVRDFGPLFVGTLWIVVAPFAFGLYFAKKFSEREDDKR